MPVEVKVSLRGGSDLQQQEHQQRLPRALWVLTLAAVTSSSLSILSLYHIVALKAEVAGLQVELSRRRQQDRAAAFQHGAEEAQATRVTEVGLNTRSTMEIRSARKRSVEYGADKMVLQPCLQMMANSKRVTSLRDEHTTLPWQTGLRRGNALQEDSDTILVNEEGFYFVYSQVYYLDKTFAMGHFVIRKKKNVVGDEMSEVILFRCIQYMNPVFPYNTCYSAGVVKLDAGDRLELLIPRQSANVSLDGDSTFLGAIKLW